MYGGDSESPVRAGDAWLTRIFNVSLEPENYSYSLPLQFEVKHTLDGLVIAQSWATLRTNSFWYSNENILYKLTAFDAGTREVTLQDDYGNGPDEIDTCFYLVPQTNNATVRINMPFNGTDVLVGIVSNVVPIFDDNAEGVLSHYEVYVVIEGPVQVRWRYLPNLNPLYFKMNEFRLRLPDFVGNMQLLLKEVVDDNDERLRHAYLRRLCKEL